MRPPPGIAPRTAASPTGVPRATSGIRWRRRGASRKATNEAFRSLAVMVSARLPLVDALKACARQTTDDSLRGSLDAVRAEVEQGRSLSQAIRRDPAFGTMEAHLVEVGESTGLLGPVLLRLAEHRERSEALRRTIRQALTYPAFVMATAVAAVAFLLVFVVPTFADLYADFEAELPAATRFVLDASTTVAQFAPLMILLVLLGGVVIRRIVRTPRGRLMRDRALLAVPVYGGFYRNALIARFSRTLSTLLENGVPLTNALALLQRSSESAVLALQIEALRHAIERGEGLAVAILRHSLFPPVLVQLATVGEATGQLADVLKHAAGYYEAALEAQAKTLSTLLEPILIVFIGLILGGILIAMYLPMFDLVTVTGF